MLEGLDKLFAESKLSSMKHGRERLREWINRSKMTQRQAAEIIDVSEVVISLWLSGDRTPELKNAVKIEQVSGIAVESWLLTEVSDEPEAVSVDGPKL